MGYEQGFSEDLIAHMSSEAGEYSNSPEDLLCQIEDMLESGELTVDEVKQFLADKQR